MNEQNILIVRCGEVALKGMNKPYFERMLVDRIRRNLKAFKGVDIKRQEGLIFIRAEKDLDIDAIIKETAKVFGVASISKAVEAEPELNAIGEAAVEYMMNLIETRGVQTFKVEAKRADKNFPVKSPEIGRIIGAKVLVGCKVLKVNVHEPDVLLHVDVRHDKAYIYEGKVNGFGGLPLGTNGKGMILLSGGIDSPVAAWMMAKRGMMIEAVHFHSYPYTSERAKEKVIELARIVASYTGRFNLYIVPFTEQQLAIRDNCPEDHLTLIMRRMMMMTAERIALKNNSLALITGESLGQVASQTIQALGVTNEVMTTIPVFRPLIGMDKNEIVTIARNIGTFETSILPYEDCCTVFTPKHPTTKPTLEKIMESQNKIDMEYWVNKAVEETDWVLIEPNN